MILDGTANSKYTSRRPINYTTASANSHHSWTPGSAKVSTEAQTKKFRKGERNIPSETDKALKYYTVKNEHVLKKVR